MTVTGEQVALVRRCNACGNYSDYSKGEVAAGDTACLACGTDDMHNVDPATELLNVLGRIAQAMEKYVKARFSTDHTRTGPR